MLSACWLSVCLLLWRGGCFSPLPVFVVLVVMVGFFFFAIEVYEHFNKSLRLCFITLSLRKGLPLCYSI